MLQALLPYPNFEATAEVLDTRRLGLQRRRILRMLNMMHGVILTPGLSTEVALELPPREFNLPSVQMWAGYEVSLCEFGLVTCEEWAKRKGIDNVAPCIETHMDWATSGEFTLSRPPWWGDISYHLAQQSYLIRKDAEYYQDKFPGVPPDLPLVWPVTHGR